VVKVPNSSLKRAAARGMPLATHPTNQRQTVRRASLRPDAPAA